MKFKTADLCDQYAAEITVVAPLFRDFGGSAVFCGPISTVSVFEDNLLVRAALETPGDGRVLVIDGGGSLRCALVGDLLADLGQRNGWAGIVVHGCVRDAHELREVAIGVRALATNPLRSAKRGSGERDLLVAFADATFVPGHYLYADQDGIIVAERALAEQA